MIFCEISWFNIFHWYCLESLSQMFSNAWSHEKNTFECRGHNSRNMYEASYLLRSANIQNIGFIFIWKMKIFIRYRIFLHKHITYSSSNIVEDMWQNVILNFGYELWKMIILTVILCQLAKQYVNLLYVKLLEGVARQN